MERLGDGCPHRRGPTIWGGGDACPGGGRCLWSYYGGRRPPSSPGPPAGGRGVLPRRRSLPMERLRGTAAPQQPGPTSWGDGKSCPVGAGPPAGGTGSPAQEAVAAYGAPAGDGSPHRRGPTSQGDRESCPRGGRCLLSACEGRRPPSARAHRLRGRKVLPGRRSRPMEHLQGDGCPHRCGPTSWGGGDACPRGGRCLWSACGGWRPPSARAHQLGGRGVLPRRRSLPMERLRGTAAPQQPGPTSWGDGKSCPVGAGPPAGGTGSPAQEAVAAY